MEIINKYFPDLSKNQKDKLGKLGALYQEWNDKINVISRKDFEFFYERHVLFSLSISKHIKFKDNTKIIDVGTGGGFPGIPLAIMFPNVEFLLIDSIGKKIKVVEEVVSALGLENVKAKKARSEEIKGTYDFIVSRAVTKFPSFVNMVKHLSSKKNINTLNNGIFYLKGGDFFNEIKPFKNKVTVYDLDKLFEEEFFETKKLIYFNLSDKKNKK